MVARKSAITNHTIHAMIDWYKVLREMPAFADVRQSEQESLAHV